jgi:hypothetical protein
MSKAEKVYWTEEEKSLLTKEIAERRLKDVSKSLRQIFEEVQTAVLPEDRRRKLPAMPKGIASRVQMQINQMVADFKDPEPLILERDPETVDEDVLLSKVPTDKLLLHAMLRFSESFGKLELFLRERFPVQPFAERTVPRLEKVAVPEKKDRYKVCIVGLLADQFQAVYEKCKYLPVDFVHCKATNRISFNGSFDFIIVSKFSSHKWWNKVRGKYGDQVSFIDGGITSVVQQVHKYCHVSYTGG